MNLQEFQRRVKAAGLTTRKQKGLEVIDVKQNGVTIVSVRYADIFHLTDIRPLLAKHRRP